MRRIDQLEDNIRNTCSTRRSGLLAVLNSETSGDSLASFCASNPVMAEALKQILADAERGKMSAFKRCVIHPGAPLLRLARKTAQTLNDTAHKFAFDSVLAPIAAKFLDVKKLHVMRSFLVAGLLAGLD